MKILRARFRIVTPMFLGGAEGSPKPGSESEKIARIRVPSFKGALRFWWRALNWGRIWNGTENDIKALRKLFDEEGEIFGTAAGDKGKIRQSRVLLQAAGEFKREYNITRKMLETGHKYLLGMGLYNHNTGVTAAPIKAGEGRDIQLSCCFHRSTKGEHVRQVAEALTVLGCLGGLGARSRRGWGSLALHELQAEGGLSCEYTVPKNCEEFTSLIRKIVEDPAKDTSPFSAFSRETRIDLLNAKRKTPWEALGRVGKELHDYRNFQLFKESGAPSGHRFFPHDRDKMFHAVKGTRPSAHPKRVIFGLPHNYFFKPGNEEAKVSTNAEKWKCTRRASPLLIHIHQFPDGTTAVVQTLLQSSFLPQGVGLEISSDNLPEGPPFDPKPDWQILTDYLDRFKEVDAFEKINTSGKRIRGVLPHE